jgi:hypothetical protein
MPWINYLVHSHVTAVEQHSCQSNCELRFTFQLLLMFFDLAMLIMTPNSEYKPFNQHRKKSIRYCFDFSRLAYCVTSNLGLNGY